MKIDIFDIILTSSTHPMCTKAHIGLYICSKYKNKMQYESYKNILQVILSEQMKIQVT